MRHCPECDAEMEHIEAEDDVNIRGGFFCDACDKFYPDEDFDLDD